MKKLLCFLSIVNILFLSACGVYSDYRDLDGLIIVESMGADYKNGAFDLSFASSAANGEPLRISAAGSSMNTALQNARTAAVDGELFFSHIDSIIIGEESADSYLYPVTEFICRSPNIRTDADLYVFSGDASEAIKDTGSDSSGIAEQLSRLHEAAENGHETRIYSTAEVINFTEKYGAALIFSLKPYSVDDETKSVIPDGYMITKDYKPIGKLRHELTPAASLLDNRVYITPLKLPSGSVQIESGNTDFELLYSDGEPEEITVTAKLSFSVLENPDGVENEVLISQLEQRLSREMRSVLRLSKETGADFLALSYKTGERRLDRSLPYLKFTVNVSAELKHSNDIVIK